MSKIYEVCYSLRGSIEIEAENEKEAKEKLLSSDYTDTKELLEGVEINIIDAGNDAINIDDIYESRIVINIAVNTTKEEILEKLKNISQESEIPVGFTCLGRIGEVYPDLPEGMLALYRASIWEWRSKSVRIAIWDLGSGYCSFMCEGSEEKLKEFLNHKDEE